MKRIGKRGAIWERVRRQLKQEFFNNNIVRCEICGTDNGLSFAHSRKRRFIQTEEDWREVALLCLRDHAEIEKLPHSDMYERINEIIRERSVRILEESW